MPRRLGRGRPPGAGGGADDARAVSAVASAVAGAVATVAIIYSLYTF